MLDEKAHAAQAEDITRKERLELYPPADPLEPLFKTDAKNHKGNVRTEVPSRYFEVIKELKFNETPRRVNNPLEKIDFHALRHTFATFMAMAGVDHVTLKKLMGHKKLDMTLRYIEIADSHQAERIEKSLPAIFPALDKVVCPAGG
jgi:integrase